MVALKDRFSIFVPRSYVFFLLGYSLFALVKLINGILLDQLRIDIVCNVYFQEVSTIDNRNMVWVHTICCTNVYRYTHSVERWQSSFGFDRCSANIIVCCSLHPPPPPEAPNVNNSNLLVLAQCNRLIRASLLFQKGKHNEQQEGKGIKLNIHPIIPLHHHRHCDGLFHSKAFLPPSTPSTLAL
uniref:Uncharacterized protein n=1 Tax=Anopheles darlingi TaxID=43151 RepID=A0A2M4DLC0_ANODA